MDSAKQKLTQPMTRRDVVTLLKNMADELNTSGDIVVDTPKGSIMTSLPETLQATFKLKQDDENDDDDRKMKFSLKLTWTPTPAAQKPAGEDLETARDYQDYVAPPATGTSPLHNEVE